MVSTGRGPVDPTRLYELVRKRARLHRAWAEVHRNAITSKSLPTKREACDFERHVLTHLDRIARQLQQRRFKFAPQKGALIPKSSGSLRPLVVAPIESRVVQRSILDTLQDIPSLRSTLCAGYNFGGVPGRDFGVPGAILKAQSELKERPYFIRTDIQSFFENVDKPAAIARVLSFADDRDFAALFTSAVETEIADANRYGSNIHLFPLHDEGVAQGSCLSPLLCNILLSDFDIQMNGRGIVTIRYIDDILILGASPRAVRGAFQSAQRMLAPLGLECYDPDVPGHRGKAEQGSVTNGLNFLGCELNGVSVRPNRRNRLELLSRVRRIFNNSLDLIDEVSKGSKSDASYAETLVLVGDVIQGWANTFAFCTDDRIMGGLDADVNRALADYTREFFGRLRKKHPLDRRRALGVFAAVDRVEPLSNRLIKSLALGGSGRKKEESAFGG